MAAATVASVSQIKAHLDSVVADADLEPSDRIARLRALRADLADLVGITDTYLGENELARESSAVQRQLAHQTARENADIREELIRRGMATAEQCEALGLIAHATLDEMEADGTLGEALEEAFGLGALHGDAFNSKVKRDKGKFSTMNVAGAPKPPAQRGAARKRTAGPAPRPATQPYKAAPAKPAAPAKTAAAKPAPAKPKAKPAAPSAALESVQAQLAAIDQHRLNDWPTKDEGAAAALGEAKDSQAKWSSGAMMSPGTTRGSGVIYKGERKPVHDKIIGHFVGNAVAELLGEEHPITAKLKAGEELSDAEENAIREAARKHRGGAPPKALFMAGGGGAGKSTALREAPELKPSAAVELNPDDIKEMIPEYQEMVASGSKYAAAGVHEESSDVCKRLEDWTQDLGLNMLIDGTGNSKPGKFIKGITQARDAGYDCSGIYVTIPTDDAVVRATNRAIKSGRWVPEPVLREAHASVSRNFEDVSKLDFLRDLQVFDGRGPMGTTPTMIWRGGMGTGQILDQQLYDEFIGKKDEWPPS